MIREASSFPSAPHDDDVDAFTQAMTVFRMELREALGRTRNRGDVAPGVSPGYDYAKHQPRARETGEEAMQRLLGTVTPSPLATRYRTKVR